MQVWECGLHGVVPPGGGGSWSDEVVGVCSASGLALGGLCTVIPVSRKKGAYQVKVTLRSKLIAGLYKQTKSKMR